MQAAVIDLDHVAGDPVDEVPVVRDEHDGAREAHERVLEHLLGGEVEVVGGLVETQERGGPDEHLGQGHAGLFSARQHGHALVRVVAAEEKGAEDRAQALDAGRRIRHLELLEDRA